MEIRADEGFAALGQSINDLILQHRKDLERNRETSRQLKIDPRWLEATSTLAGPKTRWVDGTPKYSLHICWLRKLFPAALFIHVVRDFQAVGRSMVNFHRVTGIHLVANEAEACRYWIRRVSACLMAKRAYGPNAVHRWRVLLHCQGNRTFDSQTANKLDYFSFLMIAKLGKTEFDLR